MSDDVMFGFVLFLNTNKTKRNKHKTKQNNTKQNKTKQNKTKQNKTSKKMEMERKIRWEMEDACRDGNLEVVKNILSSHPESINFSDEVGNLFFFFFFSFFLQHLILNLVFVFHRYQINGPPYIMPVGKATRRLFQCCWPTKRMCMLRVR